LIFLLASSVIREIFVRLAPSSSCMSFDILMRSLLLQLLLLIFPSVLYTSSQVYLTVKADVAMRKNTKPILNQSVCHWRFDRKFTVATLLLLLPSGALRQLWRCNYHTVNGYKTPDVFPTSTQLVSNPSIIYLNERFLNSLWKYRHNWIEWFQY